MDDKFLCGMLLGVIGGAVLATNSAKARQIVKDGQEQVKEKVEYDMYNLLKNSLTIEQSREIIKNNLNNVKAGVDTLLQNEKYELPFDINFGLNYFPKKEFKGIVYDEGYYESVVVTLGEGLGDNWWCVLFPPLCMLEAEETNLDDVEYTTLVKTVIDKYF